MRLVPLDQVAGYDVFSSDARFLRDDLPRLEPALGTEPDDARPAAVAAGGGRV